MKCPKCLGNRCANCNRNGFILVEAPAIQDFVVRSGAHATTEDFQVEIKGHGGYWDRDLAGWRIDNISKESGCYALLKSCGLRLFPIEGTER